jgi:hypothetical protein
MNRVMSLKWMWVGAISTIAMSVGSVAQASELVASEMLHAYAKMSARRVLQPAGLEMLPGTLDLRERETHRADLRPAIRAITGQLVEDYIAEFTVQNAAGEKRPARMVLRVAVGHDRDNEAAINQTLIQTADRSGEREVRSLVLSLGHHERKRIELHDLGLRP